MGHTSFPWVYLDATYINVRDMVAAAFGSSFALSDTTEIERCCDEVTDLPDGHGPSATALSFWHRVDTSRGSLPI